MAKLPSQSAPQQIAQHIDPESTRRGRSRPALGDSRIAPTFFRASKNSLTRSSTPPIRSLRLFRLSSPWVSFLCWHSDLHSHISFCRHRRRARNIVVYGKPSPRSWGDPSATDRDCNIVHRPYIFMWRVPPRMGFHPGGWNLSKPHQQALVGAPRQPLSPFSGACNLCDISDCLSSWFFHQGR